MMFFLLLIVIILIIIYIRIERFQGSAATITQTGDSYLIQPIQGYNGPLKVNYVMSDTKTSNIPNSAILNVRCADGRVPNPMTGLCA